MIGDYTSTLITAVLAMGSAISLATGYRLRGPKRLGTVIAALVLTLGLSILLMVALGSSWDFCALQLGLCAPTNDQTVWYIVLLPLLQWPINWCLMLLFFKGPSAP